MQKNADFSSHPMPRNVLPWTCHNGTLKRSVEPNAERSGRSNWTATTALPEVTEKQ